MKFEEFKKLSLSEMEEELTKEECDLFKLNKILDVVSKIAIIFYVINILFWIFSDFQ